MSPLRGRTDRALATLSEFMAGVAEAPRPLLESVKSISKQDAIDRGFFGPVYHGTSEGAWSEIEREGFRVFKGAARTGMVRHGYERSDYGGTGSLPPVHHLGYGIYFTTAKAIAKQFGKAGGAYYLDVPRLETINFGSPRTMMAWWIRHGYNPKIAAVNREYATELMTDNLASKYDAVWYKGKGLYRLLDGDQVCIYDPARIYHIDPSLSKGLEVGAKVRRKSDGMTGEILRKRRGGAYSAQATLDILRKRLEDPGLSDDDRRAVADRIAWYADATAAGWDGTYLEVRWKKGGTDGNVVAHEIEPISAPKLAGVPA